MDDKSPRPRGDRRTRTSLVGVGIVVAVVLVLGVFAYRVRPHFDRQRWKDAAGVLVDSPRAAMVNDLGRRHLRVGMTRGEVLGLLGDPDAQDSNGRLIYAIGRVGLGTDSSEYIVSLDGDGRITSWRFEQH